MANLWPVRVVDFALVSRCGSVQAVIIGIVSDQVGIDLVECPSVNSNVRDKDYERSIY